MLLHKSRLLVTLCQRDADAIYRDDGVNGGKQDPMYHCAQGRDDDDDRSSIYSRARKAALLNSVTINTRVHAYRPYVYVGARVCANADLYQRVSPYMHVSIHRLN